MRYREPGQPLPAPNRPPRSPLATEATPYLGVRNSPVVTGRLAKASLGDRESVFEVLEPVGEDDDRVRLVLVGGRDPFPVPGEFEGAASLRLFDRARGEAADEMLLDEREQDHDWNDRYERGGEQLVPVLLVARDVGVDAHGERFLRVVCMSVSATTYSFQAAMKVKMTAVT